jgi:hypothetical protein
LLVDTEGLILKAKVHGAKVMDFERGSRSSSKEPTKHSLVSVICGWTALSAERVRARTG